MIIKYIKHIRQEIATPCWYSEGNIEDWCPNIPIGLLRRKHNEFTSSLLFRSAKRTKGSTRAREPPSTRYEIVAAHGERLHLEKAFVGSTPTDFTLFIFSCFTCFNFFVIAVF